LRNVLLLLFLHLVMALWISQRTYYFMLAAAPVLGFSIVTVGPFTLRRVEGEIPLEICETLGEFPPQSLKIHERGEFSPITFPKRENEGNSP
jgi:hypothetical protein